MSEYVKLATGAGDQYLAALAESQEQFIKAASTYASSLPKATPAPAPAFTPELPTVREVVDANFAFATKLLKQQKEFTEKLLALSGASV